MYSKLNIKQEIFDPSYEKGVDDVFSYESTLKTIDEIKKPPEKKIKVKNEIRDPRLLKRLSKTTEKFSVPEVDRKSDDLKCPSEINYTCNSEFVHKSIKNKADDKKPICSFKPVVGNKSSCYSRSLSPIPTLYENVLQEIFQWSPEWLQGSVRDKPPLIKFESQMKRNGFKYDYTREEYISRHLPFILRGLFIKLSDTFKNEAPSRCEHIILINDCANTGHSQLNRQLICYSVRNIRLCPQPIAKVNDVITISGKTKTKKKYFGVVSSHSIFESNDLDSNLIRNYESLAQRLDEDISDYLLWDRLTILTKRAQNSYPYPKQLAKMDVLMNAGFDLRLINNLLDKNLKCTKLLSNIFNGNANIHQFSEEELKDFGTIKKTLVINSIDMISKSNPMVFFKGINSLMVVDISDNILRFKLMCDIAIEAIMSKATGKLRILVITSSEGMSHKWHKKIQIIRRKSSVRPWYVDSSKGWTKHMDVSRFVISNAKMVCDSLSSKLERETNRKTYKEMYRRKQVYEEIKDTHNRVSSKLLYGYSHKSSSFLVAREELNSKGLEIALNDSNVLIGTFCDVLNCQQLLNNNSKPFDCCIIDDSHLLSDSYIMSIIHLGISTMIIGGDSDQRTDISEDSIASDCKFNVSLFERIIKKCLNLP